MASEALWCEMKTLPVNVNATHATTGVTALLLPAQNTHTLHDPTHTRRVACVSLRR